MTTLMMMMMIRGRGDVALSRVARETLACGTLTPLSSLSSRSSRSSLSLGRRYKRTWAVPLMETTGAATGFCCYAFWCGPCASFQLRRRALYNDMSRYLCCAGYLPCSGRCGESRCPNFCLGVEVCLCFSNSVASTRWLLQDEQHLSNTKCDNCIIATTVAIQYISCIFSLLAICIDGLQEAACILDWTADLLWCSMWYVRSIGREGEEGAQGEARRAASAFRFWTAAASCQWLAVPVSHANDSSIFAR
jgi:hypothetical protein